MYPSKSSASSDKHFEQSQVPFPKSALCDICSRRQRPETRGSSIFCDFDIFNHRPCAAVLEAAKSGCRICQLFTIQFNLDENSISNVSLSLRFKSGNPFDREHHLLMSCDIESIPGREILEARSERVVICEVEASCEPSASLRTETPDADPM
jgi:hypothetical protein